MIKWVDDEGLQKTKGYKIVVSVILGLIGFLGAFYTTRIDFNGFSINFIWSISLPLLVSLAWGPRYGVLSITLGLTMLYPFFLGYHNGWASLVPSLSLYMWMIIHGYGGQKRQRDDRLYYNIYFLQLIYAGLRWIIYIFLFPTLVQFNPPFWNPQAYTHINMNIVLLFVIRGIIMESVLLALCDALLLLPPIRKVFGLTYTKSSRYNTKIMSALVAFGLAFTLIILMVHNFIIDQQDIIRWMIEPDEKTRVTFLMSAILFVIMGGITVRFCERVLEGQEALKASEEKYHTIFEGINDLYIETTLEGIILIASPSAKEILDYEANELIGMNIMDLYYDKKQREELIHIIAEKEEINNYEVIAKGKSGQRHYLWLHVKMVSDNEGAQKMISVARDVTNYKEAMEEIQILNRELEQRVTDRTAELQSAVSELEGFAYTISHDLKSPLRAIDGYSNFMKEDYSSTLHIEVVEMIDNIQEICADMIGLIDKLLAYSVVTKAEIHEEPVDVKQMILSVFRELEVGNATRKMELSFGNELPILYVDRLLFKQVIANILSNAIKFSKGREMTKIKVDCTLTQDGYLFSIEDNGVGFDMRFSNKLFGIFQRMHRRQEFEGAGVGLATVRKIITKHGGRVWIEGEVNRGAKVCFILPLKRGIQNEV